MSTKPKKQSDAQQETPIQVLEYRVAILEQQLAEIKELVGYGNKNPQKHSPVRLANKRFRDEMMAAKASITPPGVDKHIDAFRNRPKKAKN